MNQPKKRQVHMTVQGRVQAVGFRFFTWQTASKFNISGWVRNRSDGSVEMTAEGTEEAVHLFIQEIKKGSPFSHVAHVDVQPSDHIDHFSSFEIRDTI